MDIIQVVIFIVITALAIVQQISKAGKEKKTASPKDVLADMFPEIEQEGMGEELPVSPAIRSTRPPRRPHRPASPQTVAPRPTAGSKQEGRIKLTTREEARRAFIYSEIFNRKY